MNILVTGGSGFIGAALVRSLEARYPDAQIVNVDVVHGPGIFHKMDIRSPIDISALEHYDFAACVHLAAVAKEPGYPHAEYFSTNTDGTRHVLDACAKLGINSVIFTSTMMVHSPSEDRLAEGAIMDPSTAYGSSKALAEGLVREFAARTGASAAILRPAVVFGPGDEGNFERLRVFLDRKIFFFVGRDTTVKSCVHVADVVGFIEYLLDRPSDPSEIDCYNVAIPAPTTIREITAAIQRHFNSEYRIPTIPYQLAHAASRPFEVVARLGLDVGIHRRRIEKLYESTNIDAAAMVATGYDMRHQTVDDAVRAWAASAQ